MDKQLSGTGAGSAREKAGTQPYIGRSVVYGFQKSPGEIQQLPGIITELIPGEGAVRLTVFHPNGTSEAMRATFSQELSIGCWTPIAT
jgi:hypothetical protein